MAYSALTRDEGPPPGRLGDTAAVDRDAGVQEKGARGALSPAPEPKTLQGQGGRAGGQGPIVIRAETVDHQGMHVKGAALGLSVSYTPRRAPAEQRTLQTVSDDEGRGRLEVVASAAGERVSHAYLWAYKPGQALAVESIPFAGNAAIDPIQLVLEEPVKRRIAVVGSDGRPIEGLRVVARSLQEEDKRVPLLIPDDWHEQLTVTTDANGVATIPYLSRDKNMLTVSVGKAGIARHVLPMPERQENGQYVLKLGEIGRLVGIVRTEGGEPLADVHVLVWVRAAGTMAPGVGMPRGRRRATPTEVIEFSHDSDRVRTGPQGAFQTPSELLRGSSYRVSVRRDGFEPFVSDWVALDGERTTLPPIRLRSSHAQGVGARPAGSAGGCGPRVLAFA